MGRNVLVIDDEQDILKLIEKLLIKENFQVRTALGAKEGIEIFKSEPIDVVISDMRMPGLDGLTVIRKLKEIDQDIEIIILTGHAELSNVIEAFRHYGAFDYLAKPLESVEELFIAVNRAIESRLLKIENKVLIKQLRQAKEDLEDRVEIRTAELKKMKGAAEAANLAKSNFLANMSHELRTPLNHIIGFTELIIDNQFGDLNSQQKEYLSNVLESGKHLLSLVNDILDLSKVETGRLQLEASDIDIRMLLGNSLTMIKEKALRHNLKVILDPDSLPEHINADEGKLKQIIYNLLSNAVKFTPDNGKVILSAKRVIIDAGLDIKEIEIERLKALLNHRVKEDHLRKKKRTWIEFSVSDNGIGIKHEDHKRIFEHFEQAEDTVGKKYQGTGLGLSLTKSLVELHGGKVWVESEGANKGSNFRFIIPVSAQDQ